MVITQYFQGSIDDVRIYNRALSPTEVTRLYDWRPGPSAGGKWTKIRASPLTTQAAMEIPACFQNLRLWQAGHTNCL